MHRLDRALAAMALASSSGLAGGAWAQDYPFVGRWDCEVSVFEFTSTTYDNGGGDKLKMRKVERSSGDFLLSFPDGYRIALSGVKKNTMTWHSPQSGDTFECRRVK